MRFKSPHHDVERLTLHVRVIAEARQPMHILFFSKPGYLAFSVLARGRLRGSERLFGSKPSCDEIQGLAVTERLERFGIGWDSGGKQGARLRDEACFEHALAASVQPAIEQVARRIEAEFNGPESGERFTSERKHGG